MKFLNKYNTGKYNIRMTQTFLNRDKVDSIKKDMMLNQYNFKLDDNKIGCEVNNNIYFIGEGHHRMQAALEIWKESNDYSNVENLIKNAYLYHIKHEPISFRFKF
jgi:hypothetical protein